MNTNSINQINSELNDYPITDSSIMDYNAFLEFLKTNIENPDLIIPDIDIVKENDKWEKSINSYLINTPEDSSWRVIKFSNLFRNNIELILDSKNKASLSLKKIELSDEKIDINKREVYLRIHYILASNKITHWIEDIKRISDKFSDFLINDTENKEIIKDVANATKSSLTKSVLDISVAFPFQVLNDIKNISKINYFEEIEKANKKEDLLHKIIGNYKLSVQIIISELKKSIEKHSLLLEKLEKKLENNDFKNDEEKNQIDTHINKIKLSIENGEKNIAMFEKKINTIDKLYFVDWFEKFSEEIIKLETIKITKFTNESKKNGSLKTFKLLKNFLNQVKKIDEELIKTIWTKLDNFVKKWQVILSFEKASLNLWTDIFWEKKKIDPKYNPIINFDITKLIAQSNKWVSLRINENTWRVEYIAEFEWKLKFSIENWKIKMTIVNPAEIEIVEENLLLDTDVSVKEARRNIQTSWNIEVWVLRTWSNLGWANINVWDSEKRTNIEWENISGSGLIKSSIAAIWDVEFQNFQWNLIIANSVKLNAWKWVNSYSSTFECNNLQAISWDEDIVKSAIVEEWHWVYCTITTNKGHIWVLNWKKQNFILLQTKLIKYINDIYKIKWSAMNPEIDSKMDDANWIDNKLQKWYFKKPSWVVVWIIKKVEFFNKIFKNYNTNINILDTRRVDFLKKIEKLFSKTHKSEDLTKLFWNIETHFISDMWKERDNLESYTKLLFWFLENAIERIIDFSEIKNSFDKYVKSHKKIWVSDYLDYLAGLSNQDFGKELNYYFSFINHETILDASSWSGKYEINENKLFEKTVNYLIDLYIKEIYKELWNITPQPWYTSEFKNFLDLLVPVSLSDKYLSEKQAELEKRQSVLNSIKNLSWDQEFSWRYNFSDESLVQIDDLLFNENNFKWNAAKYIIEFRKRNIFKQIWTRNFPLLKGKWISIKVEWWKIHYNAEIIFENEIIRMINSLDDNIFLVFANSKIKPKLDENTQKLVLKKAWELREKLLMLVMDSLTTPVSWENVEKNWINRNLIANIEEEKNVFEKEILDKLWAVWKLMHWVGNLFKK